MLICTQDRLGQAALTTSGKLRDFPHARYMSQRASPHGPLSLGPELTETILACSWHLLEHLASAVLKMPLKERQIPMVPFTPSTWHWHFCSCLTVQQQLVTRPTQLQRGWEVCSVQEWSKSGYEPTLVGSRTVSTEQVFIEYLLHARRGMRMEQNRMQT